jgi:glycosyltransferase involved in cell wall biosynthesis
LRHVLSVIIPASNEEAWIGRCLSAVFRSDPVPGGAEVVVVANGCSDATVPIAQGFAERAERAGWKLTVLDLPAGSKPGALNAGDAAAQGELRVYLDADVTVSPELMAQLALALAGRAPLYVGATPVIPRAESAVTRAYGRFWQRLPFAQSVAPGYGLLPSMRRAAAGGGSFPRSSRTIHSCVCSYERTKGCRCRPFMTGR